MPDAYPPPHMDHAMGGRKESQYSLAMARHILARAWAGESITAILASPETPSRRTLYDWIKQNPGFEEAWTEMRLARARAQRARHDADLAARRKGQTENPRRHSGRRSTYARERAEAVCALIREGLGNREIGRAPGMPSMSTIHFWLRRHPEFRDLYDLACQRRDFNLWLQLTIAVDLVSDGDASGYAKAAVIEKQMADHRPKVWRWT